LWAGCLACSRCPECCGTWRPQPTDCRRTGRLKWTHRMPVCEPRCPRARSGVWEPAAELLARTRVDRDWDRRDQYSAGLAELALHHTGWFDEWRRVRSGDPDVALVAAELEIDRAWEIRTAARARHVSREQFQAFHTVLRDAIPGPAYGRRPKPQRSRSLAGAHRSSNGTRRSARRVRRVPGSRPRGGSASHGTARPRGAVPGAEVVRLAHGDVCVRRVGRRRGS
jgi:hypothetical protein